MTTLKLHQTTPDYTRPDQTPTHQLTVEGLPSPLGVNQLHGRILVLERWNKWQVLGGRGQNTGDGRQGQEARRRRGKR